jgi:hypothetical protein
MMYAIVAVDAFTGNRIEVCRVGTNPGPVAEGVRRKIIIVGKRRQRAYTSVEIVEVGE